MVKTKERYLCEHCGKELKNRKALAGHLWFAHQKRPGEKANLKEEIRKLESEPRVNPGVSEKIDEINNVQGELTEMMRELLTMMKQVVELTHKDNPGNPDPPEPKKEEKPDDEDDRLPNFFGDDDEKKSEKTDESDDDKSWFL